MNPTFLVLVEAIDLDEFGDRPTNQMNVEAETPQAAVARALEAFGVGWRLVGTPEQVPVAFSDVTSE